jgi:hypothetical protein
MVSFVVGDGELGDVPVDGSDRIVTRWTRMVGARRARSRWQKSELIQEKSEAIQV